MQQLLVADGEIGRGFVARVRIDVLLHGRRTAVIGERGVGRCAERRVTHVGGLRRERSSFGELNDLAGTRCIANAVRQEERMCPKRTSVERERQVRDKHAPVKERSDLPTNEIPGEFTAENVLQRLTRRRVGGDQRRDEDRITCTRGEERVRGSRQLPIG